LLHDAPGVAARAPLALASLALIFSRSHRAFKRCSTQSPDCTE
jgi:hypothetical protein